MVHTDSEWQFAQKVVEDALRDTNYACQSLERLPGRFINFAFRNKLVTPILGRGYTVVVKMMEDKLKVEKTTGEEFTLHKTRSVRVSLCTLCASELLAHQMSYAYIKGACAGSPSFLARVPEMLHCFPGNYIHIVEDLPNTSTFKAHSLSNSFDPDFAGACGRVSSSWAVKFHRWGRHPDQEVLRRLLSKYTEAGVFKCRLSCGRLKATIERTFRLSRVRKSKPTPLHTNEGFISRPS